MYKAVFIDVDGTLITSDHRISMATFDTIQKLKEQNILVVLVSARPLSGIIPLVEELGLLSNPVASLNGAYIASTGEIIFDSMIDHGTMARLHASLQKYTTTNIYYQHNQWFSELRDHHTDHEQKITSVPIILQPFSHTLQSWQTHNTGPNKLLVIGADAIETKKIENDLKAQFDDHLNIYTSKPIYLEVMNKKASKTNAVKFIIGRYHIIQEETIAIGDNFNDKEMIQFAGKGVAMGNAPDEIKAVANYITDTNNNDGVSKALNKIFDL